MKRLRLIALLSFVLLLGLGALTGCYTFHSDLDRPGIDDITAPPDQMEEPERIQPLDPGGDFVGVSLRPVLELGTERENREGAFTLRGGLELWVGRGETDQVRHLQDGSFLEATGATLGWLPYSSTGGSSRAYAELEVRIIGVTRLGAVWSLRPDEGLHGPQITFGGLEAFHLRWNWDVRHGWGIFFGVSLPFYAIYGRSR